MQQFDHANIIKMIGVCGGDTCSLWIVMELARFGELRSYLQCNRRCIDTLLQLTYCCQLSNAMAYLEGKKFLHRYHLCLAKKYVF